MSSFNNKVIVVFLSFAPGLVMGAEGGLKYTVKDIPYTIKQECLAYISLSRDMSNESGRYSLGLQLRDSELCAKKFNQLIASNVGDRLKTYFNSRLINDSFIASNLKTQNVFTMSLDNVTLGNDIIAFYSK